MKIAVTTPTGNVGSHVVRNLIRVGVTPTVLLRDASKLEPDIYKHVEAIELDQGDSDAVVAATRNVDALYWVDPPNFDPDPIATYARMGTNAARAVSENGIGRTVFQSSVGAEARGGFGEIDGLARTEEQLDATGASVTHLRCGYFFVNLLMNVDQLRDGVLPTTLPVGQAIPWVDPRDIADLATARLLNNDWSGRQTQGVHGPADLSFADAAQIVSEAAGRKIEAVQISDDDLRGALAAAGLGPGLVEAIVGMMVGTRNTDFTPENERSVITTTPTTLGAWAYANLRPLLS